MSKTPLPVLLIKWPDSQRIMEHPDARAIDDDDYPNSYIVSAEIWEKYKNSYYEADSNSETYENKETCVDCGKSYDPDNITYCATCSQVVCDRCYSISGRDISCKSCQKPFSKKQKCNEKEKKDNKEKKDHPYPSCPSPEWRPGWHNY